MFFGSKGVFGQSDWANVYVGSTEMKKIYVGEKLVWEKPGGELICDSIYPTVTIGTQTWMAANLHCDDGEGGIYSYNDDTGISDIYGYLYTWSAAMRMDTIIEGWHLPTKTEWETLRTATGGGFTDAGKLKETGTTHWNSPNNYATNELLFTAFGAGRRDFSTYQDFKEYAYFWSSTIYIPSPTNSYLAILEKAYGFMSIAYGGQLYAVSVRLIKD
jgi:uncharacterized protein (TIGR02145 family)